MKHLIFLSFLLLIQTSVMAQISPITQVHGARAQAMGNMRVHGKDAWSYFNNPGGLAYLEQAQISTGFDHRYGLKELSTLDLTGSFPTEHGVLALGVSRFGGKLFNQQSLGIAFANKLGIVAIGGKAEWFQTQMEGFGTGNNLILSLGGIAELSPEFSIGASFFNLNRAKLSQATEERLPTGISMGINYQPVPQLQLQAEVEKDIEVKPVVKLGIEYVLRDWVLLRTGINSNPSRMFFGLGIKLDQLSFDYAYGQNQPLGTTHHISLGLKLGK
ncbi:hypothetical protein PBT90_11555 [Algoriphagus halophytocola]|uniref:PorV/PorQ family protein n=1 Tax=Algoriphagus halophytocola TaxID=2991499 RepID=A0ABY6MKH0_9BACT|nr:MULTISPECIES: hypothetical protein [unclassified Algoriphagus]UZD24019.1 hypothetical protein OM944_05865 [Algoriphagus sp. TR-M5]WBL41391.1 hypothetical protein PBT90_11555 [Algoriphagus sp. TR-M9]